MIVIGAAAAVSATNSVIPRAPYGKNTAGNYHGIRDSGTDFGPNCDDSAIIYYNDRYREVIPQNEFPTA